MFGRISEKQALHDAFEIYKELAKTGESDKFDVIGRLYDDGRISKYYRSGCPLCEHYNCDDCPFKLSFGHCLNSESPYRAWRSADNDDERKIAATLIRDCVQRMYWDRRDSFKEKRSSLEVVLWLASAIVTGILVIKIIM
jgi:hypothetical protein